MEAYLLECLYATGWRRTGEVYWRYADAMRAANIAVSESARAVRVLPVRVGTTSVLNLEATEQTEVAADA